MLTISLFSRARYIIPVSIYESLQLSSFYLHQVCVSILIILKTGFTAEKNNVYIELLKNNNFLTHATYELVKSKLDVNFDCSC